MLTPGLSSSVTAVPGAGGCHLPGPEPHRPRGLRGLRVLLPAGRGRADQAARLLLRHLDGGGGRARLLVSVPLRWAQGAAPGVLRCPQWGKSACVGLPIWVFLVVSPWAMTPLPLPLPPAPPPPNPKWFLCCVATFS